MERKPERPDLIGRIFAQWTNVDFGLVLLKLLKQPSFLSVLFHGEDYEFISTKNILGNILGDFFTNTLIGRMFSPKVRLFTLGRFLENN
jgi:hypothetical protein